jgi:hypothetical protein
VAADRDVIRTEHAVLLASRIPNARLDQPEITTES